MESAEEGDHTEKLRLRTQSQQIMDGVTRSSLSSPDKACKDQTSPRNWSNPSPYIAGSPQINTESPRTLLGPNKINPPAPVGNHRSMLRSLASRTSQESLRQEQSVSGAAKKSQSSLAARIFHMPCFFHQQFEDAVNVDRVLEEIAAESDGMSPSRLIQTATSVREISKQLQRRAIKQAVRMIMVVTKARDNELVYLTRDLAEWLMSTPRYGSSSGVTVFVDAKLRRSKRFDMAGLLKNSPHFASKLRFWTPDMCILSPDKFDLVITLGGDGTVLYTSWLFQRIAPPVLSFSLGSLGFLTNFEFDDFKLTLDRIMEGSGMRVNMRMRFTCMVYRLQCPDGHDIGLRNGGSQPSATSSVHEGVASGHSTPTIPVSSALSSSIATPAPSSASSPQLRLLPESSFEVLNELVLDRGPSPYVSNIELYGDNELITVIQADGVIISTPTGSTAYSLSAGGPLTHPSLPAILLTPICPHTLSFRPMVLSDTLSLRLVMPGGAKRFQRARAGKQRPPSSSTAKLQPTSSRVRGSSAYASFDGKARVELRPGDEVRVEVGKYPFPTVVGSSRGGEEWFGSVRRALRWNTRGALQGSGDSHHRQYRPYHSGGHDHDGIDSAGGHRDDLDQQQQSSKHSTVAASPNDLKEDGDDMYDPDLHCSNASVAAATTAEKEQQEDDADVDPLDNHANHNADDEDDKDEEEWDIDIDIDEASTETDANNNVDEGRDGNIDLRLPPSSLDPTSPVSA